MSESERKNRIPLYAHTVESLCDELVSGRPVPIEDEEDFKFDSPDVRKVFNWYVDHKSKWSGVNKALDVEQIVDYLTVPPPKKPIQTRTESGKGGRCLHLSKIVAHRFAGIHRYGTLTKAPEDFEHSFEKPATLIEGKNASGKTSLLNAIVWCLTGHIYRSQRGPEKVEEEMAVTVECEEAEELICKTCTPITPVPEASIVKSLKGNPVPLDTWVELTFVDGDGNEAGRIRRSLSRTARGKIKIDVSGVESLGLDPIALEVGTRMTGLIPYIQLEEASDMGKAIAALTALRPLEDLVKHARKSQEKLKGELRRAREKEIVNFDSEFAEIRDQLKTLIETNPTIGPGMEIPKDLKDKTTGRLLREMRERFGQLKAKVLEDCKTILGEDFDTEDTDNQNDLSENVRKAIGLLEPTHLKGLDSAQRLTGMRKLTDEEILEAVTLISTLLTQADQIEVLAGSPERAVRERLYARVGSWIRQNQCETNVCPVCQEVLCNRCDRVTGKKITDHLEEHAKEDREYLAKAIQEWGRSSREKLRAELPGCLSSEMEKELPEKPVDLIAKAFEEDLFEPVVFKRSLAPLQGTAQKLCRDVLATLPEYREPAQLSYSDYLSENCEDLCKSLVRLKRALAFAQWRRENDEGCKEAFERIIGKRSTDMESGTDEEPESDSMPLLDCLIALEKLDKNATPLREAQIKVKGLREKLRDRRSKERRIELYDKAQNAIDDLLQLDKLVELQVASLMRKLSKDVMDWKDKFYSVGRVGIPEVAGTDVGPKGSLIVEAEVGGTKASARHISNASDLRATLLAVLISFWKHLVEDRGGLSLILLDDLQELFDAPNRRRVANSIPEIIANGGRLIVTTNDGDFGREVAQSCRKKLSFDGLDHREIHPCKTCHPRISLGKFWQSVDKKRKEFKKPENENEDQPARDYVKDLRIYIEDRLYYFFDDVGSGVPVRPMFSYLINGLRRLRNSGQKPFTSQAFCNLLEDPVLRDNSPFIVLMNKSHHREEQDITYREVCDREGDCGHIRKLVEYAHEDFERFMHRDVRGTIIDRPQIPESDTTLKFKIPLIENLAAATWDSGISDIADSCDTFSREWLSEYAIYAINTDNLGFSAPRNCRVIVRLNEEPVKDNSLVVALHKDKVYARRFLGLESNPQVIALGSEDPNPLNRKQSLLLPSEEVRLLQVVGVLFDRIPHEPRDQEAALLNAYRPQIEPQIAFTVRGDSALPLAIRGQTLLGADKILATQLEENKGEFVAVAFSGNQAFKRIGESLPGHPRLRMFESIGGLGDSILLRTEKVVDDPFRDIPLFETAYRIVGVVYDSF